MAKFKQKYQANIPNLSWYFHHFVHLTHTASVRQPASHVTNNFERALNWAPKANSQSISANLIKSNVFFFCSFCIVIHCSIVWKCCWLRVFWAKMLNLNVNHIYTCEHWTSYNYRIATFVTNKNKSLLNCCAIWRKFHRIICFQMFQN